MARKRRVLYVDMAPSVGGGVVSLYHLVKGLDRNSYEAHVVLRVSNSYVPRFRGLDVDTMVLGDDDGGSSASAAGSWSSLRRSRLAQWMRRSAPGESSVHLAGLCLRTYPKLWRQARALRQVIKRVQPDLVHLNDVVCVSRAGIMAARVSNVPAICHLRAMATRSRLDRWLSRFLRGYICISHAVDRHQREQGGRAEPSWVVYNGLDLSEFDDLPDPTAIRAEFGFAPADMVVGCVGRLRPWKGQHVLLHALAELAPKYPGLRGLIIGAPELHEPQYGDELLKMSQDLGLEGTVKFTGYRHDVPSLLKGMDLMVHASISPEPFGRVIIESMAARTVVIGTDAGGVPEVIQDRVTGLLVPPDDVGAMAQAIAHVLDHPQEREAWRVAARRLVEQEFTATRYVKGVEHVYEGILR